MQRSNTYIILFAAALTIICGGLLAMANVGLKDAQDEQIQLDTKKKILGAVMDISTFESPEELLKFYEERVKSEVVDINGNPVSTDEKGNPVQAEKVNVAKYYKFPSDKRLYPVYVFKNEQDPSKVDAYVFPLYGNGLWDAISGYIALESDLNTVRGVTFDHKGETPGLGARITTPEVQARYKGKKVFEGSELVSVTMVKGEHHTDLTDHQVDGMSGASLTGKGVNNMVKNYLNCYLGFIEKVKSGDKAVALN